MTRSTETAETIDRIEAEDLARARWYSFFSRWLLAPPDRQAIDMFLQPAGGAGCGHPDFDRPPSSTPPVSTNPSPPFASGLEPAGSDLESAWRAFGAAVAATPLDAIRTAYDQTFISVGEAPVSLHASVYLTGFSNERPLAEVRRWLAAQGIQGSQSGLLTEDHLGLLCEVMAWLIIERGVDGGDGAGSADAAGSGGGEAAQQYLFQRYIAPVIDEFCQRLADAPDAGVYLALGRLFAAFGAVERQAFNIDR